MNIAQIIIWKLGKGCDFVVKNGKLIWSDKNIECPSVEDLKKWEIELEKESDAQAYSRKRQAEYPSIQECVHAILDDDLTALQKKRQAIKTKYPKS